MPPEADPEVQAANALLAAGDPAGEARLRALAEGGSPLAQMGLGQRLIHGMGLPADPIAGEAWLRRAAEAGFPPAMEAWGKHAGDPDWLRRAAEAGFAPAMGEWAAHLLAAGDGAAADAWIARGMAANLGRAYALAAGRAADPREAERLLFEAFRRRDLQAGLALGMRRHARRDFAGAAEVFAPALRLESEAARINVAAMVRRGEWPADRPHPPVPALIGDLARAGDPFAAINMLLWEGADDATARTALQALDATPAIAWWRGLAAQGDPEGARVLGWLGVNSFNDP